MASVAQDFNDLCFSYGSIILQEYHLLDHEKTIKPSTNLGGRAGGVKYIHGGILFKVALALGAAKQIYADSDEFAAKAAGHEFRSNSLVFKVQTRGDFPAGVQQVHTPLTCIIDYRGLRCLAVAMLPLQSLRYGSDDAGGSVHADLPALNRSMEAVGARLGLGLHTVGGSRNVDSLGVEKKLATAVDVEGHLGTDSR